MRALVVEDEFISRMMLEKLLSSAFEVDAVVNGEEAKQAFDLAHESGKPYDLILLDIMMPLTNGLQALEYFRKMEAEKTLPKTKVIMTTALSDMKTVMRAFDEGQASAYIVKPINRDKLFKELEKIGLIHA